MTKTKAPMTVHCVGCEYEWVPIFLPAPVNQVARAMKANKHCPRCQKTGIRIGKFPRATPEGDPLAWATGGDTGVSAETIWGVMMGRPAMRPGTPHDPSDFGRCYRLLKIMPSWRSRLSEVSAAYPKSEWPALVAAWDELTALYEKEVKRADGMATETYALMKVLRKERTYA